MANDKVRDLAIKEMAKRELARRQTVSQSSVGQAASGTSEGVANILGLPVDALASAMKSLGVDVGQSPIGGAESIKDLLSPFIGGAPQTGGQRLFRRIGQEVGSAIVPGGALAAKAAAPSRFLAGELGLSALGGGAAGATAEAGGGELAQLAAQVLTPLGAIGAASAVTAATRRALTGGEPGRQIAQGNVEAFQRLGVEPSLGQALQGTQGGFPIQALTTGVSKVPGGQSKIIDFSKKQSKQLSTAAERTADRLSQRQDVELAGLTIKRGILDKGGAIDRFKNRARQLYNAVDEFIPAETPAPATNSIRLLEDIARPIPGAENISQILTNRNIIEIRDAFLTDAQDGLIPYGALKQIRTRVGDLLTGDVVADAPRASLKRLYGALSEDMERVAGSLGEDAVRSADRASEFWKNGMQRIDDVLDRISKKTEPEQIFKAIESGDVRFSTVRTVMRSLRPSERDVVASTLLKRLGQATPGQADEFGEGFSASRFLTNWNKVGPKSRRLIFSSNKAKQYSNDIQALAKTSNIIKEGSKAISNPSGTASQGVNIATVAAGLGGGAVSSIIPITVGLGMLGARSASKILTSPEAVRFIVSKSKLPIERFTALGARLAAESDDVELQNAINEYLGQING